jgi:DNA-binding response OmpR family regulator
MAQKVLIADDDPVVHESLGIYLKAEGFETVDAFDGAQALESITPEVVLCVLDIMMPKMSGIEVCREIRGNVPAAGAHAHGKGRGDRPHRRAGARRGRLYRQAFQPPRGRGAHQGGAPPDDGAAQGDTSVISYNGLTIDLKSYTVTLRGQPVICTPKEIEILHMLASNPGQVFTREQLLSRVWGYDFAGETRTVDTHIKRIRAKLDSTGLGWSIKTIYGVGYKFETE